MAFSFFADVPLSDAVPKGIRVGLLHEHGCAICPLNQRSDTIHPHMPPSGSDRPSIYVLGEAPGEQEDQQGIPFVGPSGQLLRWRIPGRWESRIRWNNVVRTRPPENRDPSLVEIECCRPSVVKDIEATKPPAIFGFGNVPLHWVLGESGIGKWRGKQIPVKIGSHTCWYFPMLHPSYVLRMRRYEPRRLDDYGCNEEFTFAYDLRMACEQLADLPEAVVHTPDDALRGVTCLTGSGVGDAGRVIDFIQSCYGYEVVGLDYETKAIRPYAANAKLLSIALSNDDETMAFPLFHPQAQWSRAELDRIIQAYADFLYDAPCKKAAHSLTFEQEWSACLFGEEVLRASKWEDTLSQAYIRDPRVGSLSLENLCLEYFGLNIKAMFNLDIDNLDLTPLSVVLPYNGVDAKYCRLLYREQEAHLADLGMQAVYEDHLKRVPTMVLTQMLGIPLDLAETNRHLEAYQGKADTVDAKIAEHPTIVEFTRRFHRTFRPSATKDVQELLSGVLGVQVSNTEAETLREIEHPIIPLLLESRKHHKVIATYLKPMLPGSPLVWPDGRLHPQVSVCRTRTQRTASDYPNEQNWPKRGDAYEVRSQVKPEADEMIVSFDYAGIQARNVAMESNDARLVEAFFNRYDIHKDWMNRMVRRYPAFVQEGVDQLSVQKIHDKYRHRTKNQFVFPSFFGAAPPGISTGMEIPLNIIEAVQEEFFDEFAGVLDWHKTVRADYKINGFVSGLSGFRRYAPVNYNEQINTPIQSDESVIVCDAMDRLSRLGIQPIMMIHDDFTFAWKKHRVEELTEIVVREMLRPTYDWINVPLGVERSMGPDWYNMKKAGEWFSDELGLSPMRRAA